MCPEKRAWWKGSRKNFPTPDVDLELKFCGVAGRILKKSTVETEGVS